MTPKSKIAVLFLALILIGIQFYRPYKNIQIESSVNDFLIVENASEEMQVIFKNSCYDCHSNYTDYAWYDNIAPMSWFVDANIKNGKNVLNFSEWESTELISKKILITAIPFDISTDKMPKSNYIFMKPEAELTEKDKQQIISWINNVKGDMLWEE